MATQQGTGRRRRHPLAEVKGGWMQREDAMLVRWVRMGSLGSVAQWGDALPARIGF